MASESVGIRELQQHASDVVRQVAAGEVVEVTLRGRPVARLVPLRHQGLAALVSDGLARRATTSPQHLPEPLRRGGADGRTLGDLLREAREGER